jgi:hypothetical protein
VNGTAVTVLGGTLQINLLPGAVVNQNEDFVILQAIGGGELSGTFASITGAPLSLFKETDTGTELELTALQNYSSVPLPPGLLLFAAGLAGLATVRRRFKK